ncbi:chalcone isomerase family protein [Polaromonas sp.]|uniref:chalcone isomerase family protein n=1 Tax=Polaromonas sp. TaxID=1869339 RepID=UPI00286A2868|nr:chalcone isomerase family protein [Polaromonas sp.]
MPHLSGFSKWLVLTALALCGFLPITATSAATVEIAGVKVSDAAEVAGANLVLNGAGVRYKGPFKVYTAALYMNKKASTPEAVHAAGGAKRVVLTMLREIDSRELGNLFMRSMENNTPKNDLLKVLPSLPRMGDIFAEQKKMAPGDAITIDWIPGTGMVLSAKGKVLGQPFKESEFFHAMLGIWIGKDPADWMLKDALLGVTK